MKITIELEMKSIPSKCEECSFFNKHSINFGRTKKVSCILTGIGDSSYDNRGEENSIIKKMIDNCPFNKGEVVDEGRKKTYEELNENIKENVT